LTADLAADAWPDSLDRLEELLDLDLAAADAVLVAEIGPTVAFGGAEYDTAALLAGRLVQRQVAIGRCGTRGWLGAVLQGAIPETEDD
jgi:hypothetical protein